MITVKLCDNLGSELNMSGEVEVEPGGPATVGDILASLGIDSKDVGLITRDGRAILPAQEVADGECIQLFPHLMGG